MKRLFAMVSAESSNSYTKLAIKTFFECTALQPEDIFLLIDNDATGIFKDFGITGCPAEIEVLENAHPQSFAENANLALERAKPFKADLFFLNNDLVFFPGWESNLIPPKTAITISASNQNFSYRTAKFQMQGVHTLEDYLSFKPHIESIAKEHIRISQGFRQVLTNPYYCVRLPYEIYSEVGLFDETFTAGGGEDCDYSMRAALAGFKVFVALKSFVLHFVGCSTWSGPESSEETKLREENYANRLIAKWGNAVAGLLIGGEHPDATLRQYYDEGKVEELLNQLGFKVSL